MNKNMVDISGIKNLSVEELFGKFSSGEKGLADSDAKERVKEYGPNEISEKQTSALVKFLSYFWGPIP
jgi:H+-transporting ATPase